MNILQGFFKLIHFQTWYKNNKLKQADTNQKAFQLGKTYQFVETFYKKSIKISGKSLNKSYQQFSRTYFEYFYGNLRRISPRIPLSSDAPNIDIRPGTRHFYNSHFQLSIIYRLKTRRQLSDIFSNLQKSFDNWPIIRCITYLIDLMFLFWYQLENMFFFYFKIYTDIFVSLFAAETSSRFDPAISLGFFCSSYIEFNQFSSSKYTFELIQRRKLQNSIKWYFRNSGAILT